MKNSSVLYVLPQSWTLPYARFPQSIACRQEEKQEDVSGDWVIRRKLAEKMYYVSRSDRGKDLGLFPFETMLLCAIFKATIVQRNGNPIEKQS